MKRLNKGLLVTSGICGGLGLALLICGMLLGGIGEYFNIDPTLVRLAWVIFSFLGGSGILAYIIASIIIPK